MFGKKLSSDQLNELRSLQTLIRNEEYKYNQVKNNTFMVPSGQKWCKTQKGVIDVLVQARESFISDCCASLGIKTGVKIKVDLNNGKVYES